MRRKKAAMLRKARSQKYYFQALKMAAEMDEEASPAEARYLPTVIIGLVASAAASIGLAKIWDAVILSPLAEQLKEAKFNIFDSERDLLKGLDKQTQNILDGDFGDWDTDDAVEVLEEQVKAKNIILSDLNLEIFSQKSHRLIMSIFIAVNVLGATLFFSVMKREKDKLDMSWVEYIKYFFKTKFSAIKGLTNKILKRPTAEEAAFVKAAVNPDGSLNKSVLKRHIQNNL